MTDTAGFIPDKAKDSELAKDWCETIRGHAIERIDNLITRLQNLKASVEAECDRTNSRMNGYLTLFDDASQAADAIETATAKIEQNTKV